MSAMSHVSELTEPLQEARAEARVRVLFVDHTAAMSGGEIALFNLLRFLDPAKVEPVVVLGAEGPLAEKLRAITETHVLPLSPRVAGQKKDKLGVRTLLPGWGRVGRSGLHLAAGEVYSRARHPTGSHQFPEGGHHRRPGGAIIAASRGLACSRPDRG